MLKINIFEGLWPLTLNAQICVIQCTTKMNFSTVTLGVVEEWYFLLYWGTYAVSCRISSSSKCSEH